MITIDQLLESVDLDYFNHNSFDDIMEDCLLKMQAHPDVVRVEISIKRQTGE